MGTVSACLGSAFAHPSIPAILKVYRMSYPRRIASGIATLNVCRTAVSRYDLSVATACATRMWYRIWRAGR